MGCCDCCCPGEESCCKAPGPDGICCLPEYCCGTEEEPVCCDDETQFCCQTICCLNEETCCGTEEEPVCCPEDTVCCDDVCCEEGECCDENNECGPCDPPPEPCEEDEDCPEGKCCVDGECVAGECRIYWYDTWRDDDGIETDGYIGNCEASGLVRVAVRREEGLPGRVCGVDDAPREFEAGPDTYRMAVLVTINCGCAESFNAVPGGGGARQGGDSLDGETLPEGYDPEDPDAVLPPTQYVVIEPCELRSCNEDSEECCDGDDSP
jgi:hypothetical protein